MNTSARVLSSLLITMAICAASGCGQTGPLYFDEDPPADQLPPSKQNRAINTVPQPVEPAVTEEPEKAAK